MSISPTDAHRDAPGSSRAPYRNPSPGHGSPPHPCTPPRAPPQEAGLPAPAAEPSGVSGGAAAGSGRISAVDATGDAPGERHDPAVAYDGGSDGGSVDASKRVIGFRVADNKKGSYGQNSGAFSGHQSTGKEAVTSQFRSNQFGPVQINGKPSGTASLLHSDNMAEGSIGLQGNTAHSATRKNQVVNANHLLNFYYDPIARPQSRAPPPRRQPKIKPYNKDLFLQANYKFVVLDRGSDQVESLDPDKMLQWEDVICVRYSTPIPVQCPICLESPLCPQITSCGHIYCFPCILRYLLMGEEDHKGECWKKCPLCFMMISTKDLYTVLIDNVKQFHVGDQASFVLLTRPKDSLIPSLKNQQVEGFMPFGNDVLGDSFNKFTLTSDVELSVREAKSSLNNWLQKANSGLVDDLEKLPYVCAALEQLEERMKNWTEHESCSVSPPLRNSASPSSCLKDRHTLNKTQSYTLSSTLDAYGSNSDAWETAGEILGTTPKLEKTEPLGRSGADNSPVQLAAIPQSFRNSDKVVSPYSEDKILQHNSSTCNGAKEKDTYTFYQATDGQHIILHPLNIKCLLNHYGNYDMLPPRISGKILELEMVTQTEAMRRRYRYLSHFSLTTTFQLCEIDLSDVLPPSSLAPFIDEIKKREKQRKRLSRKEQEEKDRVEAAALQASLIQSDERQFSHKDVIFSLDDFEALGSCSVPSTSPPVIGERKLFSDVARLGFAAAHDSPSLRIEESADLSGNRERMGEATSVQGTRAVAPLSFANIISSAGAAESPEKEKTIGFGKKGKKPTRVLLSTSGGRRY